MRGDRGRRRLAAPATVTSSPDFDQDRRAESPCAGVAGLILAVCVITTFPSHAFAQGPNPLIGVWKVNVAKSTFSPGPPPKSPATRTYTQNGDGLKLVLSGGVNADGSAQTNQSWAAHFDGKDYPRVGNPGADMVMITMTDA